MNNMNIKLPDLKKLPSTINDNTLKFDLEDDFPMGTGKDFDIDGWIDDFHLDKILSYGFRWGASDVHITSDQEVAYSILGEVKKISNFGITDSDLVTQLTQSILSNVLWGSLVQNFDLDTSYTLSKGPYKGRRCRLNIGKSLGQFFLVFRLISDQIPSLNTLKVEEELVRWSTMNNGVWLVCGSTGTGKTTTLASILRNRLNDPIKIITIEKPIEFIYPENTKGVIVQREVSVEEEGDVRGFSRGLTAAMREAPDIILIGEVRNQEEVSELIRAAETGHLAVSTMHTNSVPTTINRIINLFEGGEQKRIISTLADSLKGICNQVLVKTLDGKKRFAVREILTINDEVRELILEGRVDKIRALMREKGQSMEQKLFKAHKDGLCSKEEARRLAPDLLYFDTLENGGEDVL